MDPTTVAALVSALQSVGLGNLIVVLALVWGYRVMSKSAGALGGFLKDALVTVGKLADKGVDVRLAVKLVDDDGACVTPADWNTGTSAGTSAGCSACAAPASADEHPKVPMSQVISIPGEAQHCAV